MKLDVIDINNKKVEELNLDSGILDVETNTAVFAEAVRWYRCARRSGTQAALTKAEVSGTTKKPFPQKGRGMARQGSLKNPHQIGGGVAFAPKPRDYYFQLPKAKRRIALASALSTRARENGLLVVDNLALSEAKTKSAVQIMRNLNVSKAIFVDEQNDALEKSVRNLKAAHFVAANSLNVFDVLRAPFIVVSKSALLQINKRLLGE